MRNLEYSSKDAWDLRYQDPEGAGTRVHTLAGNRQFYRAKYDAVDRCLRRIGVTLEGRHVLDAAGGSGKFVQYFLSRGVASLTLTDFSEAAIGWVRRTWGHEPRVEAYVHDMTQPLSQGRGSYDFIFVMEAMFLLPQEENVLASLRNLSAVLAPGGYLLISDLFPEREVRPSPSTLPIYRPRSLYEETLHQAGVEVVGYELQCVLFNRNVFGRLQTTIERLDPLHYWLDRIARRLGYQPPELYAIKYLIGRKLG